MYSSRSEIKNRIIKLRSYIHDLNYSYYVLNKSSIQDFEFDKLLKELEELELKYPEFYDPLSPTQRVGGSVQQFNSIKHLLLSFIRRIL